MFRNGPWFTKNGFTVGYDLDDVAGRKAMDAALAVVDAAAGHPCGRLGGLVCPVADRHLHGRADPRCHRRAAERNMPIQIHAAQSISEFQEMVRRTGLTAVQWLDKLGYLGPRASIGHGIFLDHHPWVRWGTRTDLGRLAEPAPRSPTARRCSRAAA